MASVQVEDVEAAGPHHMKLVLECGHDVKVPRLFDEDGDDIDIGFAECQKCGPPSGPDDEDDEDDEDEDGDDDEDEDEDEDDGDDEDEED